MEQITKYKNRKFYSATLNCNLTLGQIRDLIKAGSNVQVTEHSTGEDITAQTLTQVLTITDDVPVFGVMELIRGRGKSSIVYEWAKEHGLEVIDIKTQTTI